MSRRKGYLRSVADSLLSYDGERNGDSKGINVSQALVAKVCTTLSESHLQSSKLHLDHSDSLRKKGLN